MSSATAWRGRRVLVTGATGIVGSWVVKSLLERGATVVALCVDLDPQSELVRSGDIHKVKQVYGSLEDYAAVERAVGVWEVDTVIHLGAQTLVGVAARAPVATFEANIRGTYHLLDACRVHASMIKAVVVASSDKAYGSSPDAAARATSVRRLEGVHGPAGADLSRHVRFACAHRAVRQYLRGRRFELDAHRPWHGSIPAARRAAHHPQRRHVRARLPLREGCRLGVSLSG
jgi:nucleoside-diphosphate-sugar epimerase